jgi:ADP-heptose:LPS heptosyltransferase
VASVLLFDRSRPRSWPAFLRELRRRRYDVVIDCMVLSPSTTTLLLMLATRAPYRIGIGGRSNDFVYTLPVPPTSVPRAHHVEHSAALAAAFGVDIAATDWRPAIALSAEERARGEAEWRAIERVAGGEPEVRGRTRLLVNLSSATAAREWPEERYAAVLRHVHARRPDAAIAVMGPPWEADRVARIAAEGGVAVTPRLRDAFALVAAADLVFSPDTSIVHAASAFGKPAVVLHTRGLAEYYGPYRTGGISVSSPDRTLAALPLEPALAALDELLSAGR